MLDYVYEENEFPLAYLITFRTYGTWLHGDERGSIGRTGNARLGTVKIDPNVPLKEEMERQERQAAVDYVLYCQ